jgi:hypothetical protein
MHDSLDIGPLQEHSSCVGVKRVVCDGAYDTGRYARSGNCYRNQVSADATPLSSPGGRALTPLLSSVGNPCAQAGITSRRQARVPVFVPIPDPPGQPHYAGRLALPILLVRGRPDPLPTRCLSTPRRQPSRNRASRSPAARRSSSGTPNRSTNRCLHQIEHGKTDQRRCAVPSRRAHLIVPGRTK